MNNLFNYDFTTDNHWIPEHALLYAVLERAAKDLVPNQHSITPAEAKSSAEWIISDNYDFYTFTWICEELQLADYLINFLRDKAEYVLNKYH